VLRELAVKVASTGVKRIEGRVLVDVALFPEGERELGTHVVISPMVVNDNLVDVTVTPGREGDAPVLTISPQTGYVTIRNEVTTVAPGGKPELRWVRDVAKPDGTRTVTLTGTIPAGANPRLRAYRVPTPSRFAEVAFTEVLQSAGIQTGGREMTAERILKDEYMVAEVVLQLSN
jgi:D-alanyl-D-alanine carboxypeptidase